MVTEYPQTNNFTQKYSSCNERNFILKVKEDIWQWIMPILEKSTKIFSNKITMHWKWIIKNKILENQKEL